MMYILQDENDQPVAPLSAQNRAVKELFIKVLSQPKHAAAVNSHYMGGNPKELSCFEHHVPNNDRLLITRELER